MTRTPIRFSHYAAGRFEQRCSKRRDALHRIHQRPIVSLGTLRTMIYRQDWLDAPTTNVGGEARKLVEQEVKPGHILRVVIIPRAHEIEIIDVQWDGDQPGEKWRAP